jgi:geranylgeranyl reductase family protein
MTRPWDLAVVGAGPAGAATALGALRADPSLRVILLDRARFPRDKACGDGVAPHVVALLEQVGVSGLVAGCHPVSRLQLRRGDLAVDRVMARPAWVVPRTVFDHRLVEAAQQAGARLLRHRVHTVEHSDGSAVLDGAIEATVVVGADGAESVVRRALGLRRGPVAVALRGYAPTARHRTGAQVIAFGTARQPSYAWSFDRGDGLANVGYGELLTGRRDRLNRAQLLEQLDTLLLGAAEGATGWRGAQLPLAGWRWRSGRGRILLAGDAAGLVNPMTGEGIYYAVATGLAAGRAVALALSDGDPGSAGSRYSRLARPELARHLRHTAAAARLCLHGSVLDAGLRAAAADEQVFDDLVELGLAAGKITPTTAWGLARAMATGPAAVGPQVGASPPFR